VQGSFTKLCLPLPFFVKIWKSEGNLHDV
jgi:hypothetical protein